MCFSFILADYGLSVFLKNKTKKLWTIA